LIQNLIGKRIMLQNCTAHEFLKFSHLVNFFELLARLFEWLHRLALWFLWVIGYIECSLSADRQILIPEWHNVVARTLPRRNSKMLRKDYLTAPRWLSDDKKWDLMQYPEWHKTDNREEFRPWAGVTLA